MNLRLAGLASLLACALAAQAPSWAGAELRPAVALELQGRLSEAWDQYRELLLARDYGATATRDSADLRLYLLTKVGHLSVDLGRLEEAWDVSLQLRALGTAEAKAAADELKARLLGKQATAANALPSPASVLSGVPKRYWRVQLGAFRDWTHTRTQLDILLEKGWSPWVEERKSDDGRLTAVFLVSRDPADLALLKKQGFSPASSPIDPR